MNTGDRNTKGRAILKGPKGGLYVMGPSGAKLRTFTKATAAAAAPPRVATPPRAAALNTVTYRGAKFARMGNASVYGKPVYRKVGLSTYYTIGLSGIPIHIKASGVINKTNGTSVSLKNYKKSKTASAAAPPRVATPPAMAAALGAALAKMNTIKTISGRAAYLKSAIGLRNSVASLTAANAAVLTKRAANMNAVNRAARAAKKAGGAPAPVAATPRITTAERNVRLAAIRARLNAMRGAHGAAMPKRRANVDKRLKNVVARVRVRLAASRSSSLNNPVRSTMEVPFCHGSASVPRKPCRMRKASVPVYTSPLIDDGTAVATRASDIDIDWFKRQDKYVKDLSDYDFWTAQAHTNRSHQWIGPFLYHSNIPSYFPGTGGKHIAPLWPQVRKMILDGTYTVRGTDRWKDAWIEDFKRMTSEKSRYELFCRNSGQLTSGVKRVALEMYRDDLKRIIAKAPRSRKKMVLYRGANFDIFKNQPGHWHTLTAFCSAAYDLKHALAYGSTIQRITVLPGSPVLLVAGMNQWDKNGEYEIMVNVGTKYLIRTRDVRRAGWDGNRRILRVTDVTITK